MSKRSTKFTDRENMILDRLVSDIDQFNFDEETALLYIKNRFREIDRATYYRRKKKLVSDGVINSRLYNHIKVGFAVEHFKMVDSVDWNLRLLHERLFLETSKKTAEQDVSVITSLTSEIREFTQLKRVLILDRPFISQMKAELNKIRTIQLPTGEINKIQSLPEKIDYGPPPESAMVIADNTIAGKPIDNGNNDNDGNENLDNDEPVVE